MKNKNKNYVKKYMYITKKINITYKINLWLILR